MSIWTGKRVTVMGLGRFGGGVGVASWLAGQGADVLITDKASNADLKEPLEALRKASGGAEFRLTLGAHAEEDFTRADLVIVNPAVPRPWENPFVLAAVSAGVPITTEIGLVLERLRRRDRIVGITGTVGKSTTSAMIAHALGKTQQGATLGGNIGGSLLGEVENLPDDRWVVLELSSAMLWWINLSHTELHTADRAWSPGIAVVTTFAPNHLDWHPDAAHYEASKRSLLSHQLPGDYAILAPDAPRWPTAQGATLIECGPEHAVDGLSVPGEHNRANASTALAACLAAGMDRSRAVDALRSFSGLPHRLQRVGRFTSNNASVIAFNDSKSTTPEATARAVEAVSDFGPVRLIAGGYDKGISLDAINALPLAGMYAIGKTASQLQGEQCGTLEQAVERALAEAQDGDVLLLSPGCASWDQFTHYEQRGQRFIDLLHAHAEPADQPTSQHEEET